RARAGAAAGRFEAGRTRGRASTERADEPQGRAGAGSTTDARERGPTATDPRARTVPSPAVPAIENDDETVGRDGLRCRATSGDGRPADRPAANATAGAANGAAGTATVGHAPAGYHRPRADRPADVRPERTAQSAGARK